MNRRIIITVGLFSILFTITLFLRSSPAVIANDLMQEFSILPVSIGLISSAYFWTYGIVQVPVGFLSDKYGVRNTVFVFGLIGVLGTLMFSLAQNIQTLTWARLLIGIGTAGVFVPAIKYFSVNFRPDYFARIISLLGSIACFGPILATFPLALLVEATNWRFPFLLTAVVHLSLIVLSWFYLTGWTSPQQPEREEKEGSGVLSFKEVVITHYRVVFFLVWAFLVYGVLFSFQALWGGPYLQDVFSLSREDAGSVLMFIPIGLMIGGPFWGVLSERYLQARRPVLITGTSAFLLTIVVLYFLDNYPGFILSSALFFFFGFFGTVFLINISCVKELLPLSVTGTIVGLVNTVQLLSVGFFQSFSGFYINHLLETVDLLAAYKSVVLVYGMCVIVSLILTFFVPETFPRKK